MRYVLLALVGVVVSVESAAAQTAWADKLFNGNTTKEFGTVPRGTQLKHTFTMTNIYAVPLEITNVRTSCSCVSASPSKQTLQPQETATLDVQMDASRFSGPKSIHIYLTVGPEFVSTATLRVSATSRQDVVLNPGQVNFGVVPAGAAMTQKVNIEYTGSHDFRIHEVVKNGEAPLEVKVDQIMRQAPRLLASGKVVYQMEVTLKANAAAGPLKHEVHLRTSDAQQVISVPIEATIQASLKVTPDRLRLGSVKIGDKESRNVQVRGQQPFKILKIEGTGDGLTVDVPADSRANHILTIRFQPEREVSLQRTLQIHTDLGLVVGLAVDVNAVP